MKDSGCLARSALRADVHLACVAGPDVGVVLAPGTVGRAGDVPLTCASVAREHLRFSTRDGRAVLRMSPGASPRACARSAPPMAPPSGRPSSPCGDPHPPGGRRVRGAGTASLFGLARTFRTRTGIADGILSPAGRSVDLCARHGRFPAVEAALVRFVTFGARAGLRGRRAGRDRSCGRPRVAGTPASPGLGWRGTVPGPRWASGLVRSPTLCAGRRVAGASHARGTARAAGGVR